MASVTRAHRRVTTLGERQGESSCSSSAPAGRKRVDRSPGMLGTRNLCSTRGFPSGACESRPLQRQRMPIEPVPVLAELGIERPERSYCRAIGPSSDDAKPAQICDCTFCPPGASLSRYRRRSCFSLLEVERMGARKAKRQRPGRPRGGVRPGERIRDYPTLTVRVPPETRAVLRALCSSEELPAWQMIRHLVVCFVRDLPARRRRAILRDAKMLNRTPSRRHGHRRRAHRSTSSRAG